MKTYFTLLIKNIWTVGMDFFTSFISRLLGFALTTTGFVLKIAVSFVLVGCFELGNPEKPVVMRGLLLFHRIDFITYSL